MIFFTYKYTHSIIYKTLFPSFILTGNIEYWDKEHLSYNFIQTLEKPSPERWGIYPEPYTYLVEEAELELEPPHNSPSR